MNQFLNNYLTFTRRERRGIVVLSSILLCLILSGRIIPYFATQEFDNSLQINEIEAFLREQENLKQQLEKTDFTPAQQQYKSKKILELFPFNPNHLPESEWEKLGLSEKQIKIIKNYESKGGKFNKKEDLKKIYGIQPSLYNKLEPYIVIPRIHQDKPETSNKIEYPTISLMELNSADSVSLLKLKGIGPSYAGRIMKYRDLLGGFERSDQLLEVYGMTEELYELIVPHIYLEQKEIKKININKCDKKDLSKHPYISWNVANSLINYREKHGLYNSVEDIKKSDLVNDELYLKLASYLTVE
jgi:competence protein ComEA